jgi:glucosamine 6-phosphate synthetase-like amidotransferase/phosphosugar isomerase protein
MRRHAVRAHFLSRMSVCRGIFCLASPRPVFLFSISHFIFSRGSPLLVGIKSVGHLSTDYIPVLYSADLNQSPPAQKKKNGLANSANSDCADDRDSLNEFKSLSLRPEVEYFFASDASAIIEHTNRVLYLEDDDVAYVTCEGGEIKLFFDGRMTFGLSKTTKKNFFFFLFFLSNIY